MNKLAPTVTALLVFLSFTLITCLPVTAQAPVDFSYGELPPGWTVTEGTMCGTVMECIEFAKGPLKIGFSEYIIVSLSPPPELISVEQYRQMASSLRDLLAVASESVDSESVDSEGQYFMCGVEVVDVIQDEFLEVQVEVAGEAATESVLRAKWCDDAGTCAEVLHKTYLLTRMPVVIMAMLCSPSLEPEVDAFINSFRFGGEAPAPVEEEATATLTPEVPDCQASIHYDPNIQPGQVLSPWASYISLEDGKEVVPIGEAFLIDGSQTPSVTWDGTQTSIELQYTCPGHQGHSDTITVPAFGAPTPTETSTPEQTASGEPGTKTGGGSLQKAIGAAALAGGLALGGIGAAAAVIIIAKALSGAGAAGGKPGPPPAPPPGPPAPPPQPPAPVQPPPARRPVPPASPPPAPSPPAPAQPPAPQPRPVKGVVGHLSSNETIEGAKKLIQNWDMPEADKQRLIGRLDTATSVKEIGQTLRDSYDVLGKGKKMSMDPQKYLERLKTMTDGLPVPDSVKQTLNSAVENLDFVNTVKQNVHEFNQDMTKQTAESKKLQKDLGLNNRQRTSLDAWAGFWNGAGRVGNQTISKVPYIGKPVGAMAQETGRELAKLPTSAVKKLTGTQRQIEGDPELRKMYGRG